MADTLQNITLPSNTWVDLYAATGIAVGTSLIVSNLGTKRVYLAESAATPPLPNDASEGYVYLEPNTGIDKTFELTPSGAWAYSKRASKINVQETV